PLSIWQINNHHTLGIFEAGISMPGEMGKLESIIKPEIGIFTNLGMAHSSNFTSEEEKLNEKLKLFTHCDVVIGPYSILNKKNMHARNFTWGFESEASLYIKKINKQKYKTEIIAEYNGTERITTIKFTDEASIENAISCWCTLLHFKYSHEEIAKRLENLHTIDMRLQLMHGINNCIIINDSYSADITSLRIALDFLKRQATGLSRTVILSEFMEGGEDDARLYAEIMILLIEFGISKVIVIGEKIGEYLNSINNQAIQFHNYLSTEDFTKAFKASSFSNEIILIKGARKFEFERIAAMYEQKLHQTILEINLNAIGHNIREYQRLLKKDMKIMAMVKAFAYGSGASEIAGILQFYNIDYLGVAYADEGVELVKSGVTIPVMVLNTEVPSFQSIIDYNLQPVIYSFELFHQFKHYLQQAGLSNYPVHIEIETGMNRLGFEINDIEDLAKLINSDQTITVQSAFTHLVASEDEHEDDFTKNQFKLFDKACLIVQKNLRYTFLKHISNSAAIVRHPELQMDMVRLGIGMYGVESDNNHSLNLQTVATLRSTIAQLKNVKKGESVSYNRKGIVKRDSVIATIRIGYADGYSRRFGNGVGKILVKGKLAPVIGSVCMDMTMVDVTDIKEVKEGDDVVVFGQKLSIEDLAQWIDTIPYEIMTGISQRVKRVYFLE
ncbi:MAG TPA: bifunctional UDP-N-acetylmuramoyl-tripeptide:D-alanyl-D-alanine ligase/alanine racemase, partial [Flavisolibacter sp.]|nr:bifunctional UDP-N-acetylmuramoyl-tripeptide:D-alanyl-D-alanine ligase/alanine racemase [Flavisolibacter sp.]